MEKLPSPLLTDRFTAAGRGSFSTVAGTVPACASHSNQWALLRSPQPSGIAGALGSVAGAADSTPRGRTAGSGSGIGASRMS